MNGKVRIILERENEHYILKTPSGKTALEVATDLAEDARNSSKEFWDYFSSNIDRILCEFKEISSRGNYSVAVSSEVKISDEGHVYYRKKSGGHKDYKFSSWSQYY